MPGRPDHLEVSYLARPQLRPLLVLAGFLVLYPVGGLAGIIPFWLACVGIAVMAVIIVIGLVAALRSHGSAPVLCLDPAGVTVAGAPLVPWSDLRGVRMGPMQPSWLVGSTRYVTLALLPRDGVELPGPPHYRGRPQQWGRWQRLRLHGTNLILLPAAMSASAEDIVRAAERWGGLPVEQVPYRPLRTWALLLGVGIAFGLAAGLLVTLTFLVD
ncbi:hypothetical protein SAMN04489747_1903 [Auraticoccus monumenti]|uniref:PH domain-containing protein n=1 Tax=Auraticoccus monumenti TaxID=675864 RepID=A0A1G6Y549_9ACTN|nr:hypothetical protein SAMN04489747_1903 [Auraticoccus monumenti]